MLKTSKHVKMCAVLLCRWIWWDPRGSTTPWASPCSSSASVASQGLLWQVSGLRHAKRANLFFQMSVTCTHTRRKCMGLEYENTTIRPTRCTKLKVKKSVHVFFWGWGVGWEGGVGAQGFHGGPPTSSQGTRACLPVCVLVLAVDWDNSDTLEKNTVSSVPPSHRSPGGFKVALMEVGAGIRFHLAQESAKFNLLQ